MAITAIPILPVESVSGNSFRANRIIQEALQTFKAGTVISLDVADGGVQAWDGATLTGALESPIGISYDAGDNLATTGVGAPAPMQPFVGAGGVGFGSVPNQSSAKNLAHGTPVVDGRSGVIFASPDTLFSAVFGNNGATATPAVTDVGKNYGLTIDTGGNFWYVDKNKTGANAAVQVVKLDPRDTPASGSRVIFKFLASVVNVVA